MKHVVIHVVHVDWVSDDMRRQKTVSQIFRFLFQFNALCP